MHKLQQSLKNICQELYGVDIEPELTRPEPQFGDYSTNLAMRLAGKLNKNPREIAEAIQKDFHNKFASKVEIASPGFINFTLTDETLAKTAFSATQLSQSNKGKVVVLEHTDPNPFKEFHIGHAYSNTIGVAIGKLLSASGAEIHQVSYHGDVGLHIALAVLARKHEKDTQYLETHYSTGVLLSAQNDEAKKEAEQINKKIYDRTDSKINRFYDEGRTESLKRFQEIYDQLESKFEKNYFESETAVEGEAIVRKNLGKIFKKSDGAIIFDGEKLGLHKRVFITSQDLPTYEAKEIGLAFAKQKDYPSAHQFIVITGNEIDDYFDVLIAAIKQIDSKLGNKITHISHGMVRAVEGKMSSRTGNVKLFKSLEMDVKESIWKRFGKGKELPQVVFGAIKYEFLKHRIGSDFIFNVDESISLEGNSGPYLQYAHARACSIIGKSSVQPTKQIPDFEGPERILARKISEYPEVVEKATTELMPHHICTYLYELAQVFNGFYEKCRVLGDPREPIRLSLVGAYAQVLKNGLELLNIAAPERI